MGWRRSRPYRRPPLMSGPVMECSIRRDLYEEFEKRSPSPKCPIRNWDKMGSYDKKRSHAKQYEVLLDGIKEAVDEMKEFLNEPLHKKARNPAHLQRKLREIEEYEELYDEWESQRGLYINDRFRELELRKDKEHVAMTGLCCGQRRYQNLRTCKNRATEGNFCYQHYKKAEVYRR